MGGEEEDERKGVREPAQQGDGEAIKSVECRF